MIFASKSNVIFFRTNQFIKIKYKWIVTATSGQYLNSFSAVLISAYLSLGIFYFYCQEYEE